MLLSLGSTSACLGQDWHINVSISEDQKNSQFTTTALHIQGQPNMPHLSDKTLGWSKRAKKAQPYEEVDFRGGRSREPEVLVRATFLSAARAIIKTRIVRRIDRK